VVQFAGRVDVNGLLNQGVIVYPGIELQPRRMMFTLAYLGVRPVVELHTAGLKVGELMARYRLIGKSIDSSSFSGLIQEVTL
jgi:hypothetical protein